MDRLSRQLESMRREQKAVLEVMSSFFRVYLTHEIEIPEHEKPTAEIKSVRRFARFMDFVSCN